MDSLGFRILMFLPVHPTPTTFAKMGRFGSPFAPLDFFTVDSLFATFDRRSTPLEQFMALADAIHARGGLVVIDLPLDHTGWSSTLQVHHPEWFAHNEDGTFESPGAWGVVWEDLCKLDFSDKRLWHRLSDVLLHWCHCGVDGFRCDAGYMVPVPVWQYLTAKVREEYANSLFLLEGLGGPWETTRALLLDGGLDWAYSESFQEFGFDRESQYLEKSRTASQNLGTLVNFAETHDNNRLAATSEAWARHRVASAAMTSMAGAFAITNGVEWLATEKIDVHGAASLNWGAERNIVPLVSRLNAILREHSAFLANASAVPMRGGDGLVISLLRTSGDRTALVLVNPDMEHSVPYSWPSSEFNPGETPWDLVSGEKVPLSKQGERLALSVAPGAVLCLDALPLASSKNVQSPFVHRQELLACTMDILARASSPLAAGPLAPLLSGDVTQFWKEIYGDAMPPVVQWVPDRDRHRVTMLPTHHFLEVRCPEPFRAELRCGRTTLQACTAIRADDGSFFAIFTCLANQDAPASELLLSTRIASADGVSHRLREGTIRCLPADGETGVSLCLEARDIRPEHSALAATDCGSYSVARAAWGTLRSKYDALLCANLAQEYPAEQRALLLRFRAWLRYRDFSHELALDCQTAFEASYQNRMIWSFEVPCGLGKTILLSAVWTLDKRANAGAMQFLCRCEEPLEDEDVPLLIVRPDVDSRSLHHVTKAYAGAEQAFPAGIQSRVDGFRFTPWTETALDIAAEGASFHTAPEWHYQVPLPIEQERRLEDSMDIFSPGYFSCPLADGRPITFRVAATWQSMQDELPSLQASVAIPTSELPMELPFGEALLQSIRPFVVRRNEHHSVMAGYPWFLDWGRDTLICLRGLVAAGMHDIARDTILQFAKFEQQGTLPNMIRGDDTSDRDTSDAPLWLVAAVQTFVEQVPGGHAILAEDCGGRTLQEVLVSLVSSIWDGCPNGVAADHETALVFSRPHFTWMDTNYPAATPRTGFPVEIQALWLHALRFLQRIADGPWATRASLAEQSLLRLFVREDGIGLVDCRHCEHLQSANAASPDDAVRPNQLLAITLGAIQERSARESILRATAPLLTPAGIRSLDDAPVRFPIPVMDGARVLNDPMHPFWGQYSGLEDVTRKPAYHNGTAWAWQMPLFCEALFLTYGESARRTARELLASAASEMQRGCLGFLPEIYDGNAPHAPKGCLAQAWSMTEFHRVWTLLAK
ncbi:MAG: glycogen debranching enzyme N-terminal domain-containing protein [Victivallales bacterium]|nr:glycogen debranching enzyme N-terminal domain-containing protein [Victivallales bacterium]